MSAGVILVDREGRVLMQLRDDTPGIMYPEHWGLTGGASLGDETPDQTARREVMEETGLQLGHIEPFRAYYFQDTPDGSGAKTSRSKAKADFELYLFHAPCEAPVEELVCGEGRELRFFAPDDIEDLPMAYNHRDVLQDFFGSSVYAAYVTGEAFRGREHVDALENFLGSVIAGDPWFDALMRAIALWQTPSERIDDRTYRYLVGGEAFDWLLLAERLLEAAAIAAPGAISSDEQELLLFRGVAPAAGPDDDEPPARPARLSDERLRDLIGEHKHRAHLNYLYGVVVEQALQYAVELDIAKERVSVNIRDARFDEAAWDPVYERIYNETRALLLESFRAERAAPQTAYISLSELHEFYYWLFKYRVKNQEPARVASDTRKALAQLSRIEAVAMRQRHEPADAPA
jgi:8-oxo-dGTP pyrophosphatase MutT (NUDIX family)